MNSQGIVRPESKVARSNRDALADVGRLSRQGFILEKRLRRSTDWYNLNHGRLWMAKGDSEGGRFDKKDGFSTFQGFVLLTGSLIAWRILR
jgi:hypothetical protein